MQIITEVVLYRYLKTQIAAAAVHLLKTTPEGDVSVLVH